MVKKADNPAVAKAMAGKKSKGFEAYLKEIEDIVDKLESGETDLDEAIALYEKGIKLADGCKDSLKDAKLKIEVLKKKTDKCIETAPLDSEEEDEDEESDDDDDDDEGDGTLPF